MGQRSAKVDDRGQQVSRAARPHSARRGPVAQLAEQQTLNLLVEGSIPSGLTTLEAKQMKYLQQSDRIETKPAAFIKGHT
jgi:hypothetical protein